MSLRKPTKEQAEMIAAHLQHILTGEKPPKAPDEIGLYSKVRLVETPPDKK
ncbi:MAG: hypothetical protein ACYTFZ_08755 [Planctomycetota bacterium]|jgi:hypothetical protein